MSFTGALKYIMYLFMGGWLFLLGVMAGRGTAPVTFETRGFQERLKTIVEEYKDPVNPADPDKKIELRYYEALNTSKGFDEMVIPVPAPDLADSPAPPAPADPADASAAAHEPIKMPGETETAEGDADLSGEIPVKTSRKAATFNKAGAGKKLDPPFTEGEATVPDRQPETLNSDGRYIIQVAAFKSFRDAVTQMATLEKKGFTATRTTREMDGITWYRIRIGEFATRDAATRYLEKLNQAGINGMIITKD